MRSSCKKGQEKREHAVLYACIGDDTLANFAAMLQPPGLTELELPQVPV